MCLTDAMNYQIPDYDNEPHAENKHLRFMDVLKHHSENKENPIQEWHLLPITSKKERGKCICSHPIENNYFISNDKTQVTLIIGSDCKNRFLPSTLRCERCRLPLRDEINRIAKKNFICPECKRFEAYKLKERMRVVEQYDHYYLFWFGPYYKKTFKEVTEDTGYTEFLINIPKSKWNASLHSFYKYVEAKFETEEVEE